MDDVSRIGRKATRQTGDHVVAHHDEGQRAPQHEQRPRNRLAVVDYPPYAPIGTILMFHETYPLSVFFSKLD